MVGLVLVTHSGLAGELLKAAEMIVGKIECAEAVCIQAGEPVEKIMEDITEAVRKVSDEGAIVMTDMFGGTPSNMSLSFLEEGRVEVLTGVNLPMVIKFSSERGRAGIAELAVVLKDCGRESIAIAGDYLRK